MCIIQEKSIQLYTLVQAACTLKSCSDLATLPCILEEMRTYCHLLLYNHPRVYLFCSQHVQASAVSILTVLCSYTSLAYYIVAEDEVLDWMQTLKCWRWIHSLGICFLPLLCELFQTPDCGMYWFSDILKHQPASVSQSGGKSLAKGIGAKDGICSLVRAPLSLLLSLFFSSPLFFFPFLLLKPETFSIFLFILPRLFAERSEDF